MVTPYIIVITTCANDDEAKQLTKELIEKRFAACVQANPIHSTYRWQGVIESAKEVRLLIKARAADYGEIETLIKKTHSYENPEILALPVIAGSAAYLNWVEQETQR